MVRTKLWQYPSRTKVRVTKLLCKVMGFKTPFNRLLLTFVCIASVYCFLVDRIFAIRVIECTSFIKCNESSSERNSAQEFMSWFFIREASNVTNGSCLETNLTSNNECSILNITTGRDFLNLNFTIYQRNIVANSSCKGKAFTLNASTTFPDKLFASSYNLSTNRTLCSLTFDSPLCYCVICVEKTMLLNSNLSSEPTASSSSDSNDFMRMLEKHKILFIVGGCSILVLFAVLGCWSQRSRRRAKRSITLNLEVIVSPLPNPSDNPPALRFSECDDNYCYPEFKESAQFKESGSSSSDDTGEYSYAYAHPIGCRGNNQEPFYVNTMNTTKEGGYEECRPANSGYEECRLVNNGYEECRLANSDYEECRLANSGYEECRPANSGYEECRPVSSFYEECRPVTTDGGVSGNELSRSHTSLERTGDEQDGQCESLSDVDSDIDTTVVNYVDVI